MSEARRKAAQMRALHKIAALQEAHALAELARLNEELATLRARHQSIGDEAHAARCDVSDLAKMQAAEGMRRWAEQRQTALNQVIARLAVDREARALAAQRSVGRLDALRDLIVRQAEQQRRIEASQ